MWAGVALCVCSTDGLGAFPLPIYSLVKNTGTGRIGIADVSFHQLSATRYLLVPPPIGCLGTFSVRLSHAARPRIQFVKELCRWGGGEAKQLVCALSIHAFAIWLMPISALHKSQLPPTTHLAPKPFPILRLVIRVRFHGRGRVLEARIVTCAFVQVVLDLGYNNTSTVRPRGNVHTLASSTRCKRACRLCIPPHRGPWLS